MKNRQKQALAERLLEEMTWSERILWSRLRHKQIGYSFQRQAIVMGFVVDFWCPTARVAIELDGSVHERQEVIERDREKDTVFEKCKIDLLRFPNKDVYRGMSAILIRIWEHCYARAPIPLRPFVRANPTHRHEETVEMRALRQIQEAKRLEIRAENFSHRYWKNRRLSVRNTK